MPSSAEFTWAVTRASLKVVEHHEVSIESNHLRQRPDRREITKRDLNGISATQIPHSDLRRAGRFRD
jgi:hypothetical protein